MMYAQQPTAAQQQQMAAQMQLHQQLLQSPAASMQRPYPSAIQAGLSPPPYGNPYSAAFGVTPSPPAPAGVSPSTLKADLSNDELSWLKWVRNHELLPYDRPASAAPGTPGGAAGTASLSSSGAGFSSSALSVPQTPVSPTSKSPTARKSVGYALLLHRVTGVRIPAHVDAREVRSNLRFRIQISLFDTETKTFFGRTWSSPFQPIGTTADGGVAVGPVLLYFRNSVYSEYAVAVVEYVLGVVRTEGAAPTGARAVPSAGSDNDVVVERYGVGWSILNLFGRDKSTLGDINHPQIDVEDSLATNSTEQSLAESMLQINQSPAQIAAAQAQKLKRRVLTRQLWAGTPRALLFLDKVNVATPQSMSDFSKQLTKAVGTASGPGGDAVPCMLHYELFLCKALHPFFHLFREHEFLGPRDVLPGLPLIAATNTLGIDRKLGVTRGACLPQNPRDLAKIFLPVFALKLVHPSVSLPAGFEQKLLQGLSEIKGYQWGGGGEGPEAAGVGAMNQFERFVANRVLLVGLHNGRKFIRTPFKLPLVLSEEGGARQLPSAGGNGGGGAAGGGGGGEEDPSGEHPTVLRFEGEFNVHDLMLSVDNDPALALTFELQYEVRWARLGATTGTAVSQSLNVTVAWSICLLNSARLALDGSTQHIILQRGPARTLSNARVYGFLNADEERRRNNPTQIITLSIAMEASGFGAGQQQQVQAQQAQLQGQYPPGASPQGQQDMRSQLLVPLVTPAAQPTAWTNPMDPNFPSLPSPRPVQPLATQQHHPGFQRAVTSPVRHIQPPPLQPPFVSTPAAPQFMQPYGAPGTMVPAQGVYSQSFGAQQQPYGMHPGYPMHPQQMLNLQPASGLSVGIQTGPDLTESSFAGQELGLSGGTGQPNFAGTTQGYAKVLSPGRGGGAQGGSKLSAAVGQINPAVNVFGKPISLSREFADPLKGADFKLIFQSFGQTQENYTSAPISSIILAFNFFDQPFYRSNRIPLQVERDLSYDPYNPQPHQLYNVAQDKLLANNSFTTSVNPFHTSFTLRVTPFLQRLFVEYLYTHAVEIEVWDGDSLFLLGVARLPLSAFLRQGAQALERQVQVPVREQVLRGSLFEDSRAAVATFVPISSAADALSRSPYALDAGDAGAVRGLLALTVAHAGVAMSDRDEAEVAHTLANTIPSVSSTRISSWGSSQSVLASNRGISGGGKHSSPKKRLQGASEGLGAAAAAPEVSLNTTINRPSRRRVKTILDSERTDPSFVQTLRGTQGLATSLSASTGAGELQESMGRSVRSSTGGHDSSLSRSQRGTKAISRSEIQSASLAASLGPGALSASQFGQLSVADQVKYEEELKARAANLKKMKALRESTKAGQIAEMLRGSMTAIRTIYPSYGQLIFFELAFTNPYPKRTRFRVRIDDPLLSRAGYDARQINSPLQPECQVVNDMKEWLYLKQLYGLTTPTSLTMFSSSDPSDSNRFAYINDGPGSISGGGGARSRSGRQDILSPESKEEKERDATRDADEEAARAGAVYILLEGGETAYLPVKFQSFHAGVPEHHASASDAGVSAGERNPLAFATLPGTRVSPFYEPIRHRVLQVNFETVDELRSTVAYCRVDVRPQMFSVDRTLRFHHWADEILKDKVELPRTGATRQQLLPVGGSLTGGHSSNDTYITPSAGLPLDAFNAPPGSRSKINVFAAADMNAQANLQILASEKIVKVNCSSDEVAFDFVQADPVGSGEAVAATDLSFKVRMNSYPSLQHFYLCLYTDVYSAHLHSVVQVLLYSHLRAELSAVVGQRTTGRIFLPATDRVRRVHMCSSSPELTFGGPSAQLPAGAAANLAASFGGGSLDAAGRAWKSPPFLLQPGQVNTLDYVYHTRHAGKRSLLIHLLDVDTHELVQSWLLFIAAVYPKVNNVFNISLRCGQGARKAFDYENSYKMQRTYHFESSAPERMRLREENVTIPPLAVRSIHLVIAPQQVPGSEVVFVFINDEQGKNEECLQFNLQYKQ